MGRKESTSNGSVRGSFRFRELGNKKGVVSLPVKKKSTDKTIVQRGGKNGFIELCRFIFCLGVVSHHAQYISASPGYIPIYGGWVAVEFFFILT